MIAQIIDFLINELIWSLTWGKFQLSLGLILTWMFFVFIGKLKTFPAIITTLGSYLFAVTTYTSFVAILFVHFFKWRYIEHGTHIISPLYAAVYLGIIYSILQGVFYFILRYWYRFSVVLFFMLSLISNIISALISSYFIYL